MNLLLACSLAWLQLSVGHVLGEPLLVNNFSFTYLEEKRPRRNKDSI